MVYEVRVAAPGMEHRPDYDFRVLVRDRGKPQLSVEIQAGIKGVMCFYPTDLVLKAMKRVVGVVEGTVKSYAECERFVSFETDSERGTA